MNVIDKTCFEKVAILGGAGYLGSHICARLVDCGVSPFVIDNLSTGHKVFCPGAQLVVADAESVDAIQPFFHKQGIRWVIHLANHAYVPESFTARDRYFDNNVRKLKVFLDAAAQWGVRGIIFSSSCSVYSQNGLAALSEDSPLASISPYGETKIMAEEMLTSYAQRYGFKYLIFRIFNLAGAQEGARIGEWHRPETHVIPRILDVALGKSSVFQVSGRDYPTRDGTCIRDYVHVQDAAEAFLRAVEYLDYGGPSEILNLGRGEGFSVLEVIRMVENMVGRKIPVDFSDRRQGDAASLVADCARVNQVLKWMPTRGLEAMLSSAWAWHQRAEDHLRHK